jgi:hypothetical protein
MLYATVADPSDAEGRNGILRKSRPTSRRLLSVSSFPLDAPGPLLAVLLFTEYFQGMERAPERVGSCGIAGRHLQRDIKTHTEGRETPRETQRDTRDTDKSLENPGHRAPCTSEGKKQRRKRPDTVTTMAAASLPLSSATTSIHVETITLPGGERGREPFLRPGRNDSISHALPPDLMLPALCFYSILSPFHHRIESRFGCALRRDLGRSIAHSHSYSAAEEQLVDLHQR